VVSKISTFIATIYFKGLLLRKGLAAILPGRDLQVAILAGRDL
jgi:hypothetical protein